MEDSQDLIVERVSLLEKMLKSKCDGMGKELKLLLAEMNIITNWISTRFDVELIDKKSTFFKTIHNFDFEEIDELSRTISLFSKIPLRRSSQGFRNNQQAQNSGRNGRRASTSNKSSHNKPVTKLGRPFGKNTKLAKKPAMMGPMGLVDIKEEQQEFTSQDPFEDGYIPEVDDEVMFETERSSAGPSGSRPRRSIARHVRYANQMDSADDDDDDDVSEPDTVKETRYQPRQKRAYNKYNKQTSNATEDENSTLEGAPKRELTKAQRKKYKPSEASAKRAKILANTPMMCDECGKVVKGPWTLKAHKDMHANIRRYTCHICGFAFRRKPHLNAHLLVHAGEKNLKCQFCGKGFYLRRDLARHERTHTGERPYACTFPNCGKSFNVKQHLTMHYRTHTGERPYKCTVCEKTFSQANTLRIHRRLHEGGSTQLPRRPRRSKAQIQSSAANDHLQNSLSHGISSGPQSTDCSIRDGSNAATNLSSNCNTPTPTPHPTPVPTPTPSNNPHDYRSPPDTPQPQSQQQQMQPQYPDPRQPVSNIQNPAHSPYDMMNHSWRQGINQQGLNNAGLFLQHSQMYEPLNMHYGSFPPNSN